MSFESYQVVYINIWSFSTSIGEGKNSSKIFYFFYVFFKEFYVQSNMCAHVVRGGFTKLPLFVIYIVMYLCASRLKPLIFKYHKRKIYRF